MRDVEAVVLAVLLDVRHQELGSLAQVSRIKAGAQVRPRAQEAEHRDAGVAHVGAVFRLDGLHPAASPRIESPATSLAPAAVLVLRLRQVGQSLADLLRDRLRRSNYRSLFRRRGVLLAGLPGRLIRHDRRRHHRTCRDHCRAGAHCISCHLHFVFGVVLNPCPYNAAGSPPVVNAP